MSKAIPTPRRVRITYKIYMLLFIKKLGKAVTYKMESSEQKNMYQRSYNYACKDVISNDSPIYWQLLEKRRKK